MLLVLKNKLCAKCLLALGNASLNADGLPPVICAALLTGEHHFLGDGKVKQAYKITLQAFVNTFPTTQSKGPLCKSSNLTGCIYVSRPGTGRQPPRTAMLVPGTGFAWASYHFPGQQVQ